jgi:hypothetical protein
MRGFFIVRLRLLMHKEPRKQEVPKATELNKNLSDLFCHGQSMYIALKD